MELGACHECASGSNLALHVDFCSQIHRVRICGQARVGDSTARFGLADRTTGCQYLSIRNRGQLSSALSMGVVPSTRNIANNADSRYGWKIVLSKIHRGKFMRLINSAKRESERNGSNIGSTLNLGSQYSCSL